MVDDQEKAEKFYTAGGALVDRAGDDFPTTAVFCGNLIVLHEA